MICAIHQPQYLPWLGYFDKMIRADVFVLLDNVQFKKNEWQNRNRIRTPSAQGWQWLTVPVLHDFGQDIREVKLNPAVDWQAQHRRALELNYARAPFFDVYWPKLKPIYTASWDNLAALNIALIRVLAEIMAVETKLVLASELSIASDKTKRLIDICRAVGCDTYIAGAGAEAYMDFDLFRASGLALEIQHYQHPVYPQVWTKDPSEFVSHLSVVDLLINCGPSAREILRATSDRASGHGFGGMK